MPDVASSSLTVPPDLESAGTQINGRATEIVHKLDDLKRKLTPLQETWFGDAKLYYEGLQAEWNIAAEGLFGPTGVLGQIASALNLSWNNYSECEWANVRMWRG